MDRNKEKKNKKGTTEILLMLAKAMAAKPELIGKLSTMANLIHLLAIANVFLVCALRLGSGGW